MAVINISSTTPISVSYTVPLRILHPRFEASQLSAYTILTQLVNHKESANENLISQFKDQDNILNFLDMTFQQLDDVSTDIYQFQRGILNLDASLGVNLNIVGRILGIERYADESDSAFRDRCRTQVLINICDGTLRKKQYCLLANYQLPYDYRSKNEVQLRTLSHNQAQVYVRDWTKVYDHGGYQVVDSITSAGARTDILVNFPTTPRGGFFGLEGSTGRGLSSLDDVASGGEFVGNYNRDLNALVYQHFGLEGSVDGLGLNIGAFVSLDVTQNSAAPDNSIQGQPTPTTESTIGEDTF